MVNIFLNISVVLQLYPYISKFSGISKWLIFFLNISVVYIKEDPNCDPVSANVDPAVNPSDSRADGVQENTNFKREPLYKLAVKTEEIHDYLVSTVVNIHPLKHLFVLSFIM